MRPHQALRQCRRCSEPRLQYARMHPYAEAEMRAWLRQPMHFSLTASQSREKRLRILSVFPPFFVVNLSAVLNSAPFLYAPAGRVAAANLVSGRMLASPGPARFGIRRSRSRGMWPNVSRLASSHASASGIATMPTQSRTTITIRPNGAIRRSHLACLTTRCHLNETSSEVIPRSIVDRPIHTNTSSAREARRSRLTSAWQGLVVTRVRIRKP
jgi:hypothetical protein